MSKETNMEQKNFKKITQMTRDNHILSTSNPNVNIKLPQIEQWFNLAEQRLQHQQSPKEQNYPIYSTQFVSRFGIKSSLDVMTYLNSPEGKIEKAVFIKEFEALKNREAQGLDEVLAAQHREKLAILLGALLYFRMRAAKSAKLNVLMQYQIDKRLQTLKEQNKKNAIQNLTEEDWLLQASIETYKTQIEFYNQALLRINQLIATKQQTITALKAQIAFLAQQLTVLHQRGEKITHAIDTAGLMVASILQSDDPGLAFEKTLAELNEQGLQLENKAAHEMETLSPDEQQLLVEEILDHNVKIAMASEAQQCYQGKLNFFDLACNIISLEAYHKNLDQPLFAVHQERHDEFNQYFRRELIEDSIELLIHDAPLTKPVLDPSNGQIYVIPYNENLEDIKNSSERQEKLLQYAQKGNELIKQFGYAPLQHKYNHQLSIHKITTVMTRDVNHLQVEEAELNLLNNQKNQLESDRAQCVQKYEVLLQQQPALLVQQSNLNTMHLTPLSQQLSPLQTTPTLGGPKLVVSKQAPVQKNPPPLPVPVSSSYQRILLTMPLELRAPAKINELEQIIAGVQGQNANQLRRNLNKLKHIPGNEQVPQDLEHDLRAGLTDKTIQEKIDKNSPWFRMMQLTPDPYK